MYEARQCKEKVSRTIQKRLTKTARIQKNNKATQFKLYFQEGMDSFNPQRNTQITNNVYNNMLEKLNESNIAFSIQLDPKIKTLAKYCNQIISVKNNTISDDTLAAIAHEATHALDDNNPVIGLKDKEAIMHSELRAWAAEAAVRYEQQSQKITYEPLVIAFKSKYDFTKTTSYTISRLMAYLKEYGIKADATEIDAYNWIRAHDYWLTESILYFHELIDKKVGYAFPDSSDSLDL